MIVLDASFLAKLVLEEKGSEKARRLVRLWAREGEILATIDLALPEALNVLWKHTKKIGDLDPDKAAESSEDLLKIWAKLKVYPSKEIAKEAIRLALEEEITIYDALYIQLAKTKRAALATFDKKEAAIAEKYEILSYPSAIS
jgi:predicted nucleic acid-binding protein